jgi:hypothetical protein
VWLLLSASLAAAPAVASEIRDPVHVRFPAPCDSGLLELQLWSRTASAWEPHPRHPRVPAGSCQVEDAGYLLNEIRLRCTAAGDQPAEGWRVGIPVFEPGVVDACALGRPGDRPARARHEPRKRVVIERETP